jgi:Uma2 family endonuclease
MATAVIRLGPGDHGRRMSLADFEHAQVEEGYLYELGRGVVIVSDVPNPPHLAQVNVIRMQLMAYALAKKLHPFTIASGSECKVLVEQLESERHPDLAIYRTSPPTADSEAWATWVPELVVEVVSADSRDRDSQEKPEEYLAFGVKEYWIFDAEREEMTVLRRTRGKWKEQVIRPPQKYASRLFPGLEVDCALVFEAARQWGG